MTLGAEGCGNIHPMHQSASQKIAELIGVVWQHELSQLHMRCRGCFCREMRTGRWHYLITRCLKHCMKRKRPLTLIESGRLQIFCIEGIYRLARVIDLVPVETNFGNA